MNVLLISVKSSEAIGGIATWTEHYLSGCIKAGIYCDVVNTAVIRKNASSSTRKRNLKDEFVRTWHINRQLSKNLKHGKYDVAHLNTSIGFYGIIRDYYLAKKIYQKHIPIVVHFHCDVQHWVANPLLRHYVKKVLSISSRILVLCGSSKEYLTSAFNAESIIVPNFVDEKIINERNIFNREIKRIFFVGRITELKGAREIYELARRFPDIQFELCGEISQDTTTWEKPNNIQLLGMMENAMVLEHMDASDAFIFPTYTEGFSMALAESMARGLPAIATDVGSNADMLEANGGYIVSIGDVDAMEAAIKQLNNPADRARMSKWCVNKIKNEYTTLKVMNTITIVYKGLL